MEFVEAAVNPVRGISEASLHHLCKAVDLLIDDLLHVIEAAICTVRCRRTPSARDKRRPRFAVERERMQRGTPESPPRPFTHL
jgi:hypothetical protein